MRSDPVVQAEGALGGADRAHLGRLKRWLPMLADLCFSDLVLYVPYRVDAFDGFVMASHVRPVTSQTIYPVPLVGEVRTVDQRPLVASAYRSGQIVHGAVQSAWLGEQIEVLAIPVCRVGQPVAVLTRELVSARRRNMGALEEAYGTVFDRLVAMVADGGFPFSVDEDRMPDSPRVGDGVLVTDGDGRVTYASPNAVSALTRSQRAESPVGLRLDQLGFGDVGRVAAQRRLPRSAEVAMGGDTVIALRCIPLLDGDDVTGGVALVRDVTELRRRDRMLVSKDATIREIHHRVKNNLQTISSLLRLQGRRLVEPSAREAVEESVRRIRSIALVHEILSQDPGEDVRFGEIVRPLVRMVEEGLVSPDQPVRIRLEGDAGMVPSPVATSLAVVLSELLQNAVEHSAVVGRLVSVVLRIVRVSDGGRDRLEIDVVDDGVGLPVGFDLSSSTGLGLSIVQTLVTTELNGSIEVVPQSDSVSGTRFHLTVPLN